MAAWYREDKSNDADHGSDSKLDTPEGQAMLEGKVNKREMINAENKAKQAEDEVSTPEFQTAITNDAKTQKSKTRDGKGRKNSKKATSKKQSQPKRAKEAENRTANEPDNKATDKAAEKHPDPPKLDKDTEDLFVAMDIHTGDNVKKSDD